MANHNLPTLAGTTYADFLSQISARLTDVAQGMDPAVTTVTNPPLNSIRWTSAANRWEKWNGTAWVVLSTGYAINLVGPTTLTANSSGDALRITQTGSGNALVVEDQSNDATPFVIDSAGNVVSGWTAPLETIIQNTVTTPTVQNTGTTLSTSALGLFRWTNAAAARANLVFSKSRAGTTGSHGATLSGDDLGGITFNGSDGAAFAQSSVISAQVDGTPAAGSMPGRLLFSTTPAGSSTPVERMRITSGGAAVFAGDVRTSTVVTQATVPTNTNTSATLTAASLLQGLRTGTPTAAITYTLPTGASMDLAFTSLENNMSFEWSVINLADVTHTITLAANTGHTVVGAMVVQPATSGRFLTRKTAADTFITYRIA